MKVFRGPAFGIGLLVAASAPAAEPLDFVLTRNGDEHLGRVQQAEFRIVTAYGDFVLPRALVAEITVRRAPAGEDILHTVDGSRLSGRIDLTDLYIERTAFAPLSMSFADAAELRLGAAAPETVPVLPDVIELGNGDTLRAQVLEPHVVLNTPVGPRRAARGEMTTLDVAVVEGKLRGRAAPPGANARVPVTIAEQSFRLRTAAGQTVSVPVAAIAMIVFDAPPTRGDAGPLRTVQDRLRAGGYGPQLVTLLPGEFLRGDTRGDGDPDERPVSGVKIPRGIAIGRYETTFADYDRFCDATGRRRPDDEGWGRGRRPVVNVSWRDAVAYAQWLSEQTGARYRLPTNAEWEYAARAGAQTRYWWGDDTGVDRANCSGCGSLWDGAAVAPVGRFAANAFGLYDVAGNVWEWVEDCWYPGYGNAPSDGSAYTAGGECDKRVIRGGAWSTPPAELRSANRWRDFNVRPSDDIGFRVVRDL